MNEQPMRMYYLRHDYPALIGTFTFTVLAVGMEGRRLKGEPFEYRDWMRCDVKGCICATSARQVGI